jgi:hypothetical protein
MLPTGRVIDELAKIGRICDALAEELSLEFAWRD